MLHLPQMTRNPALVGQGKLVDMPWALLIQADLGLAPTSHPPMEPALRRFVAGHAASIFKSHMPQQSKIPSGSLVPHTVKKQGEPILLSGMGGRVNACRQWPYKEVLRPSSDADACILS